MDDFTMRQSLFICSILGCNPNVPFGMVQLLLATGVTSCVTTFAVLLILYVIFPGEDVMNLEVVSNIFTVISSLGFMMSKFVLMLNKRKEMQEIFKHIENIFWRIEDVADHTERMAYRNILLQGRYTIHWWTFLFAAWLCFALRIKSLPLKCYQPKWMPLYLIVALQDVTFVLVSIGIIAIDGLIMNLFLMSAVQLKMLNREIEAMFDTMDEDVIAQKVLTLIKHHDFMLGFTGLINDTISSSMIIFLGNVVSNLCIYLYHFSTMDTIGFTIIRDLDVLAGTLVGIFGAYCIPAQICINQAEEIKISAYFSKWYEHPQYKRHISMIIARDSLGITINAGGMVKVDLETALRVVKLAGSYYMFLKNFTEA